MKKFKKWQNGVGADMHGRHALEENFRTRRDAVNDFKVCMYGNIAANFLDKIMTDWSRMANKYPKNV